MAQSTNDGFGDEPYPTARKTSEERQREIEAQNNAIKAEGLSGRQLRIARRLAQKNGLAATSDYDAVRLLRAKGIDPFSRAAMLELVVPDTAEEKGSDQPQGKEPKLPQKVEEPKVPGPVIQYDDATRAREVQRIQRDIARRRRRALTLLGLRLAFFVMLPTFLAGTYFYKVATPLYATKSEFVIQKADNGGGASIGGLFSGTGFATSQDAITVQSYLQSRDAMLRLDADIGFKAQYSGQKIDFLRRLPPDASNEAAYRLYRKMVKIGFDPTEGLVKMEVISADPQVSEQYSLALIEYAEEQVDHLTQRLREDQMQGARETYQDAEDKMYAAQQKVLDLQERLGMIDATTETSAIMGRITAMETQVTEKQLQLQQLLDNAQPNQARVDGVKGDITRLETLIADLRAELTQGRDDNQSLARVSAEMRMAELELETRTTMMQQALQQLETARIEANRQVRYLSLGVSPVAPDEATYPRRFENTLVSFLIFAGIYLMLSLTASVLREQVSS